MRTIKITDTDQFQTRQFKEHDAITISVMRADGKPRMLTILWGVSGTNAVSEYCRAFTEARKNMQIMQELEQQYNAASARVKVAQGTSA